MTQQSKVTNAAQSYAFSISFFSQLRQSGIDTVVISPGFRNSSLSLAASRTKGLKTFTCVDERGAAFFALGMAKATKRPVAVLCTSGTAVANYAPAVMEAYYSHVPLVVLTADRPRHLIGTGANQCADQTEFFSQTRFFAELQAIAPWETAIQHATYSAGRAVTTAQEPTPGPVHLNIRLEEPFFPNQEEVLSVEASHEQFPSWKFIASASGPSKEQSDAICSLFVEAKRPVFVLGPDDFSPLRLAKIITLAAAKQIPVLAEAASGALYTKAAREGQVHTKVDPVFASILQGKMQAPDLVVRWGAPLISKKLAEFLQKSTCPQVVFDEYAEAREVSLHPSIFIGGGMDGWLSAMQAWDVPQNPAWCLEIKEKNSEIENKITKYLNEKSQTSPCSEWHFHRKLSEILSDGSVLFLGNSMPIRDFNAVFPETERFMRVLSNRGLSGIDGLVASVAGISVASGVETHAVIGDLSLLHDVSSLSIVGEQRENINLTIWVINNNGGEIFRQVGTAQAKQEELFTTPKKYDLSALCKAFQISYAGVSDYLKIEEWRGQFTQGVRVIEVFVRAEDNKAVRSGLNLLS